MTVVKETNGSTLEPDEKSVDADAAIRDASLPLFYKALEPLHSKRHAGYALKREVNYRFAAKTHAVILLNEEFHVAAAQYPIIFANDENAMPLAVLGLKDGENCFVNENGQWSPNVYIPSYVRRYPFAAVGATQEKEKMLYFDPESELVVRLNSEFQNDPLFLDGSPSERLTTIAQYCWAFEDQAEKTRAFVVALREHELLVPKEVRLERPEGGQQLVTGLQMIDEERFNNLPDDTFLEWRRKGWLSLVYWHWGSLKNFASLMHCD